MDPLNQRRGAPSLGRVGLMTVAAVIGLVMTLTIAAAQQQPDFSTSHKTGPLFARPGDVLTYTIVAMNTGGAVQNVALTDTLPAGVSFVPDSCTYDDGEGVWSCDSLNPIWEENFSTGKHITTTFAVTVTTSTLRLPLVNQASLWWNDNQEEMVFTKSGQIKYRDEVSSDRIQTTSGTGAGAGDVEREEERDEGSYVSSGSEGSDEGEGESQLKEVEVQES